jgi:hypothetical protein
MTTKLKGKNTKGAAEGQARGNGVVPRLKDADSLAGKVPPAVVVDTAMKGRLSAGELDRLRRSADTVYVLDRDLRVRAYNRAYEEFALANGAPDLTRRYGIGSFILDAFGGFFREHYARVCRRVLEDGQPYSCEYECSSKEFFRVYCEEIFRLASGAGLFVQHLVRECRPHGASLAFCPDSHRSRDGLIIQCFHCHQVRNHRQDERWDWVPEIFGRPDGDTSHVICPRCRDRYYSDLFAGTG